MTNAVPKPYDFVAAAAVAMYLVQLVSSLRLFGRIADLGIVPRSVRSLPGILCAPYLHGGFLHLISNTVPGTVLACLTLWQSPRGFLAATISGVFVGGLATWLLARRSVHIGASSLVYAYFGFLLFTGYFHHALIVVSLAVWILFGRLITGMLPQGRGISFEGHFFGFAAGVLAAGTRAQWDRWPVLQNVASWLTTNTLPFPEMLAALTLAMIVPLLAAMALRERADQD
jgi:membrane associated rhomboid family serine protease